MSGCSNSLESFLVPGTELIATRMDHDALVLKSALLRKLHFILISMAAARLDGDSQGGT